MTAVFTEEEIKASENRVRQSGWLNSDANLTEQELALKKLRTQHIPKKRPVSFGKMTGDEKTAAIWLAQHIDDVSGRPLRPFIADHFDLSFDDACRAVAEAGRLIGREL